MRVSIIITTYNSPRWLQKVLWGFAVQTHQDFEILIADDGSGDETRTLIDQMRAETGMDIHHVWHEDDGFRKTAILNKAIVEATTDYLLFTDGDCIPRKDFLQVHVDHAEKGYFLSGGYFKLPMATSEAITKEDIETQRCFDVAWLKANGLARTYKTLKLKARGWRQRLLNGVTPAKATWNGHNASGWKSDILAVNGYNEDMQYGGLDRELGERLMNAGIKGKQIRYSAVVVHLDHKRGYATQESIEKNRRIRDEVAEQKITWTPNGIKKEVLK